MINSDNIRKMNKIIHKIESSVKAVQYYDNKIRQKDNVPSADNMWKVWFILDRVRKAREALKLYITQN